VTAPHVLDDGMTSGQDDGGPVSLQAAHQPQADLEPAVVSFAPVALVLPVLKDAKEIW
jgi:hypothetical protein